MQVDRCCGRLWTFRPNPRFIHLCSTAGNFQGVRRRVGQRVSAQARVLASAGSGARERDFYGVLGRSPGRPKAQVKEREVAERGKMRKSTHPDSGLRTQRVDRAWRSGAARARGGLAVATCWALGELTRPSKAHI